jgi:hypothetical protein
VDLRNQNHLDVGLLLRAADLGFDPLIKGFDGRLREADDREMRTRESERRSDRRLRTRDGCG